MPTAAPKTAQSDGIPEQQQPTQQASTDTTAAPDANAACSPHAKNVLFDVRNETYPIIGSILMGLVTVLFMGLVLFKVPAMRQWGEDVMGETSFRVLGVILIILGTAATTVSGVGNRVALGEAQVWASRCDNKRVTGKVLEEGSTSFKVNGVEVPLFGHPVPPTALVDKLSKDQTTITVVYHQVEDKKILTTYPSRVIARE